MESFIEVRGHSLLAESVVQHRATLTIAVRAAHDETALAESEDLRARCVRGLREAGLAETEIAEGAGEIWRPWFWSKKAGQEASRRLLVECADLGRLYRALATLEPIFNDKRRSLAVSMRAPLFEASSAAREAAQVAAVANARTKAEVVAKAAHVTLGPVLQIEEIDDRIRHSGAHGDEEWLGSAVAAGASAEQPSERLEPATRTRTVGFRVRFGLGAG